MAAAIMKPTVAVLQMRQLKRKLSLRFSEGISVCGLLLASHTQSAICKSFVLRVCVIAVCWCLGGDSHTVT